MATLSAAWARSAAFCACNKSSWAWASCTCALRRSEGTAWPSSCRASARWRSDCADFDRRFRHACVLPRQEFIRVSLHDIENHFLPRALAIFTGALRAQFCVLDSAAGLAGIVQGQGRGELRAENIERGRGIEKVQAKIARGELPLGQQSAENVDGIVAARESLGKIHPRTTRRPGLGNSLMHGLSVGNRGLHRGVLFQRYRARHPRESRSAARPPALDRRQPARGKRLLEVFQRRQYESSGRLKVQFENDFREGFQGAHKSNGCRTMRPAGPILSIS